MTAGELQPLAKELSGLGNLWHGAGTFHPSVLEGLARHLSQIQPGPSIETGVGKSTILFSHWSTDHTVFAVDDTAGARSYPAVRDSKLLKPGIVRFVLGPSQLNLPQHHFSRKLQAVLLDGPHGYPFPELEYYYAYPHINTGGLLIIDDIQIPTVNHLFQFLREEPMFQLIDVLKTTAIFQRTSHPAFDPHCDGWDSQPYNLQRHPNYKGARNLGLIQRTKGLFPFTWRQRLKGMLEL